MSSETCCTTHGELNFKSKGGLQIAHHRSPLPVLRAKVGTRRKREYTPDAQKDSNYWLKRNRNNEAAKRSRQRKRIEEYLLETRAVELQRENEKLKIALSAVNRYTDLNSHVNVRFKYPPGVPVDGCLPSPHVSTTLIPLHGLSRCQFTECCGQLCAQTNHSRLVSHCGPKHAANTTKSACVNVQDYCHSVSAHSDGMYASTREGFTDRNDASRMSHYISPMVSLSRMNNCYRAQTSSSETTRNITPGMNGTDGKVRVDTSVSADTFNKPVARSVLPHKLRYKVNKARFVTNYLS